MAILTREQLLTKQPVKVEKVKLSSGDAFVRQMNGKQKGDFDLTLGYWESYQENGEDKERYVRTMEDFRGKLVVHTACDKDGNLLLTPSDLSTLLENMPGPDLVRLADAAQRLNKITEAERQEILKNLGGGQDAASISSSAKK